MNIAEQSHSKTGRVFYLGLVTVVLIIIAFTLINFRFAQENPGGNDFLVHWVGTRSFILEGISPYSERTAEKIQRMVYGRLVQDNEHEFRVVYPLYSEILFAPFALISNFTLARAVWMTFLQLSIIAIALLSIRLTGWKPRAWLLPVYLLFSLLWYHGLRAMINGNAVIVVQLLIMLSLIAIQQKKDILAGILLAFSTIKPHLVLMLIFLIIIWGVSRRRWTLIRWFIGSMVGLILLGMAFIPDWLLQNLWEILRFPDYNPELTIGTAFETWWPGVGTQLKWGLTIFLTIIILIEWWAVQRKDYFHFLWTLCLTLAVSQWVGISSDPGNFVLLTLPFVLVFAVIKERWPRGGDWIVLVILVSLFIGIWTLFLSTVDYGLQPQQHSVLFIPVPLLALLGLYWSRWWVLHSSRSLLGLNTQT
jgi:hypothetical protein